LIFFDLFPIAPLLLHKRITSQNFFISDYTYTGEEGTKGVVALGTDFPSKIVRLNVEEYGGKIICQKNALLCASHTVDIEMEFTKKFATGFFGGEGFVLQALTGEGDVFVKAGGTLIRRDLKEGEKLRVSSGCLVAFVDADYGEFSIVSGQFIRIVYLPVYEVFDRGSRRGKSSVKVTLINLPLRISCKILSRVRRRNGTRF